MSNIQIRDKHIQPFSHILLTCRRRARSDHHSFNCSAIDHFVSQSGVKVIWHSEGNADLTSNFGKKWHDLNVSTHQMCILLLFNHVDVVFVRGDPGGTAGEAKGGEGKEGAREIGFVVILCDIYARP